MEKLQLLKENKKLSDDSLQIIDRFLHKHPNLDLTLFCEIFEKINYKPKEEDFETVITVKALLYSNLNENIGNFEQIQLEMLFDTINSKPFELIFRQIIELDYYGIGKHTSENLKWQRTIDEQIKSLKIGYRGYVLRMINSIFIEELDWQKYYNYEILIPISEFLEVVSKKNEAYEIAIYYNEYIDKQPCLRERLQKKAAVI